MQFFILMPGILYLPYRNQVERVCSAVRCVFCVFCVPCVCSAVQCSMFWIFVLRFVHIPLLSQFSFSFSNYVFDSFSLTTLCALFFILFISRYLPAYLFTISVTYPSSSALVLAAANACFFFLLSVRIFPFVFCTPYSLISMVALTHFGCLHSSVLFRSLPHALAQIACLCA